MSPRRFRRDRVARSVRTSQARDLIGNEEYEQSLEVLSRMRQGASLTEASRAVGITPHIVRHYVGRALEQDEHGRWEARANDRLHRRMRFLDERGVSAVEPFDAREASKLSAYWRAVDDYLVRENPRSLRAFRHARLQTHQGRSLRFLTDLDTIELLADAQEVSFEDLYIRSI